MGQFALVYIFVIFAKSKYWCKIWKFWKNASLPYDKGVRYLFGPPPLYVATESRKTMSNRIEKGHMYVILAASVFKFKKIWYIDGSNSRVTKSSYVN